MQLTYAHPPHPIHLRNFHLLVYIIFILTIYVRVIFTIIFFLQVLQALAFVPDNLCFLIITVNRFNDSLWRLRIQSFT